MAAKDTAKDLAVYVIGISGKCSNDYIGCGKSCVCHQYMYGEYAEESYSTLLQSEFDGCVINQQHVIYWGRKEETYKEMTKGQCSFMAKVNFEVFEHTILYQDGINQPFRGSGNYESRVFAPLKSYLNKYSFRSRDDVLSPEDYGSKSFSYSNVVPVAYLYVVDVSQSCPVFEEQLELMSKLIKSIHKKKQACVVMASKFDTHSNTNVERLESLASKLKITVIQCSAKYNTNINTAFKYLAAKALQLKKLSVNLLTHGEAAVQKRIEKPTEDETDDINLDIIPHINMINKSTTFSMLQNDPSEDYYEPPDFMRRDTYMSGDHSDDSFENDDEQQEKSEMPSISKATPEMLLSSTPLESSSNHSLVSESSAVSVPSDSEVAKKDCEQKNVSLSSLHECTHHDNENPQVESLSFADTENDNTAIQENIEDHVDEDELSPDDMERYVKVNEFLSPVPVKAVTAVKAQETSPYLEIIAPDREAVDNSEYYEWCEVRKLVTASVPVTAAATKSGASVKHSIVHQMSQSHDRDTETADTEDTVALTEQSTYDDIRSFKQPNIPELRCIDSTSSIYIRMHKAKIQALKGDSGDSDIYTYDYVCHSYIEMCRRRRRCSGVPPRRVKRIGYQPPIYTNVTTIKESNTYVNFKILEQHTIALPPRRNHKKPTPKLPANHKPPMPPRNIPRPKCYLSAPSAIP